jgi:biotin-(acetyl-CoA carboxylase) ligase
VNSNKNQDIFAVSAEDQTNARGTKGRNWQCGSHNIFLTIAIRQSALPIALKYLPLK